MKRGKLTASALGALLFTLGTALGLSIGLREGGTGRLIAVETSPDGRARLELYRPTRWQQRLGYDDGDYAIARMSGTDEGATASVSPPFFYDGAGLTHWERQTVDVGTAARFDRATGHWSIP